MRHRIWREGPGSCASASWTQGLCSTSRRSLLRTVEPVEMLICTGSQEGPQPRAARLVCSAAPDMCLHLTLLGSIWRRDGRTCKCPGRGRPTMGSSHETELLLSSCAWFFKCTPLLAPHNSLGVGVAAVIHTCSADEEAACRRRALAAACPHRRPPPTPPLCREEGTRISPHPCRTSAIPPGSDLPPDKEPLEGRHWAWHRKGS